MSLATLIAGGLERLHIPYSEQQLFLLARYADNMLNHGNERGLTALKDPESIVRELILDAVAAVPCLRPAATVADLGSGGGTPGLPLAIMLENTRFTLVEATQRKCRWIEEQIEDLALGERVQVVSARIEEVGRNAAYRQRYDAVVAKALAALPVLVELSLPLLQVGGTLYAYKGSKFAEEIKDSVLALRELGGQVQDIHHYELDDMDRVIVQVTKTKPTSKLYPRRTGLPQHKPLV